MAAGRNEDDDDDFEVPELVEEVLGMRLKLALIYAHLNKFPVSDLPWCGDPSLTGEWP